MTKGTKTLLVGVLVALALVGGAAVNHLSAARGAGPGQWTDQRGVVDLNQVPEWIPVAGDGGVTVGYVRGVDAFARPEPGVPFRVYERPDSASAVIGYVGEGGFVRNSGD